MTGRPHTEAFDTFGDARPAIEQMVQEALDHAAEELGLNPTLTHTQRRRLLLQVEPKVRAIMEQRILDMLQRHPH